MALPGNLYRYTPLNVDDREIRLVRVTEERRSDSDGPPVAVEPPNLMCTPLQTRSASLSIALENFPLATAPPYIALSYFWGTSKRTHIVYCCGKVIAVTANLRAALRALMVKNVWIWADAVCINQDDIPERNSQARLLRRIFASAMEVIAYLGDPPVNSRGEETKASNVKNIDSGPGDKEPSREEHIVHIGPQSSYSASTLVDLLHHPWFTRAWAISEAVLNPNVRLWYGNAEFPIDDLIDSLPTIQSATSILMDSAGPSDCVKSSFRSTVRTRLHLNSIRQLRSVIASQGVIPLYRALSCGRSATATDPRDKVYAFMSLVDDDILDAIQPDYSPSTTADDVYFAIAQYSLRHPGMAVDMLRHAGHQRSTLPSWVPDLSQYLRHPFPDDGGYQCSGASSPRIQQAGAGSRSLLVRGAVVDVIHEVLEPCTFSFHDDHAYFSERPGTKHAADLFLACARLHSFLHCKAKLYFGSGSSPSEEHLEDVIRRTLTADSSNRLDLSLYQAFHQLWKPAESSGGLAIITEELGAQFQQADAYMQAVALAQQGRRVAFTEGSYMATVPDWAEQGDVVVIALGMPMPLVLRPTDDGTASRYVGEAYVDGVMNGELMQCMGEGEGFSIEGGEVFDILLV